MNIHTQTRAAICLTCPHYIASDERSDAMPAARRMAVCEITNGGETGGRVPIPVRITVGNCPIGKFPRKQVADNTAPTKPRSCGCGGKGTQEPPKDTGETVVYWPRSARRTTMYQVSKRTRRVVSSEGWHATGRIAWYGLPMPLRWWIMLRYGIVRPYEGCGCLVWLKKRAQWLDGPLSLVERFRLSVVAPVCVWLHRRWLTVPINTGSVRIENPDWQPFAGIPAKPAAWTLAVLLVVFLALVGSVVA